MEKIACEPSVGADVEFLLMNPDGDFIPACGLIGGTKEKPLPLPRRQAMAEVIGEANAAVDYPIREGYAIQEDNVMVEWNIPPATTEHEFRESICTIKALVQEHVQSQLGEGWKATPRGEWEFEASQLQSEQAKTFGCEPDFDAYLGGVQRQDGAADTIGNWRTCGGHIHVGGDFNCPDFVAALFVELFITIFGRVPVNNRTQRAKWYGKPGIFRPKPYGIEYRTPDNGWVRDPHRVEMVGHYALHCANYLTTTSAETLQSTFRKIPWVLMNEYLSGKRQTAAVRSHIIREARTAGVTV